VAHTVCPADPARNRHYDGNAVRPLDVVDERIVRTDVARASGRGGMLPLTAPDDTKYFRRLRRCDPMPFSPRAALSSAAGVRGET
jgi:hypothetical protein